MALFSRLGEHFMKACEDLSQFARGRARDRAIACVNVCAWRAKERGGDRSPPRTPSLRGPPQVECSTASIFFISADVETAAAATTAAAPPPHRRRTAGGLVGGPFLRFCGGRFLDHMCLFLTLRRSCWARLLRAIDYACRGLGPMCCRVRSIRLICVQL